MALIRSVSGLRATLGDSLTPFIATKYALAFAKIYGKNGKILVARDGRKSGFWIEKTIVGALESTGVDFICAGMIPTPTAQLLAEKAADIAGAIVITASHNPDNWNGLKFLNGDGVFLDKNENINLWEIVDNENFDYAKTFTIATEQNNIKPHQVHIDSLFDIIKSANKLGIIEIIKLKKLKVVVDAVNSAGSFIVPELLEKLNCQVIKLYCEGNGNFERVAEPTPENLMAIAQAVKENKAHLGFAVDPDADRLVIVDENGDILHEEKTLGLTALALLENLNILNVESYDKCFVANLSTSSIPEKLAKQYGFDFLRSPVGEINVVKKMKEMNAMFGGEGSGGVILPACHYGRDSLVGIFLTLLLIIKTGKKVSELDEMLPKVNIQKRKTEFSGSLDKVIEKVRIMLPENAKIDLQDGFRADFNDMWVQIRTSNTEPIARVICEAEQEQLANEWADKLLNLLKEANFS